MGNSITTHEMEQAARRRSKTIDDGIEAERLRQARTVRVLMLGLSGAGKSTLAKQVRIAYDQGFTDKEMSFYQDLVRRNVANQLSCVLTEMKSQGLTLSSDEMKQTASTIQQRLKSKDGFQTLVDMRAQVMALTSQPEVKAFVEGKRINLEASLLTQYLFKSLDRILTPTYTPSETDVLRVRHKTTGLNEVSFHFKGFEFRLCDVDGQSSVKKKWLQNFESVSAILFAVSLSCYCSKSVEQDGQSELHDSMRVFQTVCDHPAFANAPVILFLNKKDIFQTMLTSTSTPFSSTFPDYTGKNEYQDIIQFLQQKFEAIAENPERLTIKVTNATDTPSIRKAFESSLAIVLERA